LKNLQKVIYKLDDIAGALSCFFIFANMLVVAYSVAMRIIFKAPISGLTDIVGFLSALNAALALGFTEKERGFIQVDFVKEYFPRLLQRLITVIIGLIAIIGLGFISVQFFKYGLSTYQNKNVTWVMFLPYYPIAFACFAGMVLYFLTSVLHFINEIISWKGGKD